MLILLKPSCPCSSEQIQSKTREILTEELKQVDLAAPAVKYEPSRVEKHESH